GRGRYHATLVTVAAYPPERHRKTALGRVAAPCIGLPDQPGYLVGRYVTDAADLGDVAGPANSGDHLPDVAHSAALQREVGHVHDRLVAEFKRGELALPAPGLRALFAAAHDCWNPGVPSGHVKERLDRAGPGLAVADRVAGRQHHPGHDPVA